MAAAPSAYAPSDAYSGPSDMSGPSGYLPTGAYSGPTELTAPSAYMPTGSYGGAGLLGGAAVAGGVGAAAGLLSGPHGSQAPINPSAWNIPSGPAPTMLATPGGSLPSIAPSQWDIPSGPAPPLLPDEQRRGRRGAAAGLLGGAAMGAGAYEGAELLEHREREGKGEEKPSLLAPGATKYAIAPSEWDIKSDKATLLEHREGEGRGETAPTLLRAPAGPRGPRYEGPELLEPPPPPAQKWPPPPKAPTPETADPPITSNFYLIIDGLSLTRWTEVSGLGVKFTTKNYQPGGGTTSQQLMAQKDLQTLTLVRPFSMASAEILPWFEIYAHVNVPLTLTLMACDMEGNPVFYWELEGVRPVEYNGPKFKAGEAAAMTETLKLVYTDFLASGPADAMGAAMGGAMGGLSIAGDIIGSVLAAPRLFNLGSGLIGAAEAIAGAALGVNGITFNIIPNSFKISSGNKLQKPGQFQTNNNTQSWVPNTRKLSFEFVLDCLTIDSTSLGNPLATLASPVLGIQLQLMMLANLTQNQLWSGPLPNPMGMIGSALSSLMGPQQSPLCLFMWGMFQFQGIVTSLNININVLALDGTPQRATVSITIDEATSSLIPGQNPTSGAEGATTTHTVVAGDSLASIAFQTYGHADRWRGIAELNGIDDPLQLRPGTTLLLPKPADARASK